MFVFFVFEFYGALKNIKLVPMIYETCTVNGTGLHPPCPYDGAVPIACRSCREFFTPLNMEFDFVDFRDPENVKKARQTAKLLGLEGLFQA